MILAFSSLAAAALLTSSPYSIRLAARSDLLPIAYLIEQTFAAEAPELSFASAKPRSWLERQCATARVALDVERRMTPWDWGRHSQLVVEAEDGTILGFAEVWGEDATSLGNISATSPQPALFNLCVSSNARRRGVARALLRECEEATAAWGDTSLFLKVRSDNEAASALYASQGWDHVATRPPATMPDWQSRWKGGAMPLRLLKKSALTARAAGGASAVDSSTAVAPRGFDEFKVTLDGVLAYKDKDALVWFTLLLVRNFRALSPEYRVLPAIASVGVWVIYFGVIRLFSTQPELYDSVLDFFRLTFGVVPRGGT